MIEGILASIIIEELDKEGVNLQEIKLNLKYQGYEDYWDAWLRYLINKVMNERVMEIMWENVRGGKDA